MTTDLGVEQAILTFMLRWLRWDDNIGTRSIVPQKYTWSQPEVLPRTPMLINISV